MGNSAAMANAFISEAEAKGFLVDRFDTASLNISGCLACYGCSRTGECILKDDYAGIEQAIHSADLIVFVTPLYFYGFPSQLKRVIDRFFSLHKYWQKGNLKPQKTALLACCADETEDSYQALKYSYHRSIAEMGWESVGEVLATGIWGTPDKERLREACKEASDLATTLVDKLGMCFTLEQ